MRTIPFYKPSIGEPEINEVVDCLRSGWSLTANTGRWEFPRAVPDEASRYFRLRKA